MSESTPNDFSIFERLKTSMVDPYIERTVRQAREYEAAVNETEASMDERNELIAELDRDWIYHYVPLVVTGDMWMITPENSEPEKISVVDMPVISNGFMFDPDRLMFDGEPMLGLQRISHALLIPTGRPDGLPNYAAMHLGDVQRHRADLGSQGTACKRVSRATTRKRDRGTRGTPSRRSPS